MDNKIKALIIINNKVNERIKSILYKEPLPIKEYKPYLYRTIRNLIKDEEI